MGRLPDLREPRGPEFEAVSPVQGHGKTLQAPHAPQVLLQIQLMGRRIDDRLSRDEILHTPAGASLELKIVETDSLQNPLIVKDEHGNLARRIGLAGRELEEIEDRSLATDARLSLQDLEVFVQEYESAWQRTYLGWCAEPLEDIPEIRLPEFEFESIVLDRVPEDVWMVLYTINT